MAIPSTVLGFALGWIGSMPLAGPVSAIVVERGLTGRARHGMAVAAGAALAETGWCAAALFGFAALLDRWAWVRPAAGSLGGALMVMIGIRLLFLRRALELPAPPAGAPPHHVYISEFFLGLTIVVMNVSMLLSWLGILAALHALHLEPVTRETRLNFTAGVPVGIVSWFTLLLWLLRHTHARVHPAFLGRLLRVLGGVLCAVGFYALGMVAWKLWR